MGKVVLKWSCNRKKFEDIVVLDGIREILGRVNSTTWEITVGTYSPSDFNNGPDEPCPLWTFILKRSTFDDAVKLTAKVISNAKVWSKTHFLRDQDIWTPFRGIQILGLAHNYHLDFFLILEINLPIQEEVKNEFHIAKLQNLSAHLQTMLEKEHMSDVTLKCGSLVLKAHKNIITVLSPVFEAMFSNPLLEKKTNEVVIKDMDSSVFQIMINFMYSGQMKVESESMIYELLNAGEKYQISSLKEGCIEYLGDALSNENALRILELSNLFDKQLKMKCLDYVKNNFQQLKSVKEWKNLKLKNPDLALEVYAYNENDE